MSGRTRREWLAALAAGTTGAVAGCTGGGGTATYVTESPDRTLQPPSGSMVASGSAPTYRYDAGNSGVAGAPGPTEDLDRAWSYEADGKLVTTPAVDGGTAYVGDRDGTFHAVDLESGEREWATEVEPRGRKGVDASPTVADGLVVFGSGSDREGDDARLTAVDADTGDVVWRHRVGSYARSAPAVVDGRVYAGGTEAVHCVDLATGEPRWTFDTGSVENVTPPDEVFAGVAVVDGTVFAATLEGLLHALDAESGDRRWSAAVGTDVRATPAVVDGTVYVGSYDNRVHAVSVADGEVRWRFDTGEFVSAPPAATGDAVYVGSDSGTVHKLDPADGEELWATAVTEDGAVSGGPVVAGDAVLVGTVRPDTVVSLAADDGTRRWDFFTQGTVRSPVAALENAALVPTLGNRLHAVVG